MKVLIQVAICLLLIPMTIYPQWFGQSPSPQGNNLNSVDMINENIIWSAGDDGALLNSSDGGTTWQCKPINNKYQIHRIQFLDEQNGFICGREWEYVFGSTETFYGIILATYDGGNNWILKYRSSTQLNNIFFINTSVGWAIADSGKIFKTTNGGDDWEEQYCGYQCNLGDVTFLDLLNGWMISSSGDGGVFKTTDGGDSWAVFNPMLNSNFNCMSFISSTTGWVCSSEMFKTTDGGQNWIQLSTSGGTTVWSYIQFVDENIGWCYQHDYMTSSSHLLKSVDGGTSWSIQNTNVSAVILSANFLNNNFGCAVGNSGIIITTENGGEDWTNHTNILNLVLNKVDFPSLNIGYAIGRVGSGTTATYFVIKSTDSGETWEVSDSLPNSWFLDLHFINESTGWVVGVDFTNTSGFIIKSNNGGNDWITQYSYPSDGFTSVYFTDELNGWASLYTGENLLKTTDGGNNWDLKPTGYTYQPEEIFFINSSTGWVIGHTSSPLAAKIIKTSDSGLSWQEVSPQNIWDWLYDIDFISEEIGWVVGEHGIVLKTTDGGSNWVRIWQENYPAFQSVNFVNENVGWIVTDELFMGYESALFYTTNGGESWEFQAKLPGTKGSIFMLDQNIGWFVSGHAVSGEPQVAFVYKTINGGVSFVEEESINETPIEYSLSQNYPNPFNPSTKISWQLPIGSWQTIKIYDLLGNEIATLVDEYKPAGKYEVEFDASTLPSGVYFYQLKSEEFISTKKMILLK